MEPASAVGKIASAGYRPHKRTNCRNREGFMRRLSISLAWEQTKSCLAADGRLLATVAAALVVLPLVVAEVVAPDGVQPGGADLGAKAVLFIFVMIVGVVGQLALIRLTVGPSSSVAEAIVHGFRRLPVYLVAGLIVVALVGITMVLAGIILALIGVHLTGTTVPPDPRIALVGLGLMAFFCFVGVRFLLVSPLAASEAVGPVKILQRSWELTAGHFWRLLGFLLLVLIGLLATLEAIQLLAGLAATVLLGPIDAFSPSALVVALVDGVSNGLVITVLTVMLARIYVQLSGRGSIDVSVPSSGT
jgi:hypothetical protein